MTKHVLVTGATGFLGRRYVDKVLDENEDCIVYALTRSPESDRKLQERRNLDYGDRLVVVRGDLDQVGLGLSRGDHRELTQKVDEIVHFGASTEFYSNTEEGNQEIWRTNVEGTQNILDLAKACKGAVVTNTVGTAYTAGRNTGVVHEGELSVNNGFKNVYEHSKWEAERIVRTFCEERGIPYRIFKPSIVLGDSKTNDSEGETRMMYGYLDGIGRILRAALRKQGIRLDPAGNTPLKLPLRLIGNPSTRKDFVYVDDVVNTMYAITRAGALNTAYHITNENDIIGHDIKPAVENALNICGIQYVGEEIEHPTEIEQTILQATAPFAPYTTFSDPVFDQTNTKRALEGTSHERIFMTPKGLEALLRTHILQHFGRKRG